MSEIKKVRVCATCSGIDVNELKGKVKNSDLAVGCIDKCASNNPELKGKVYGFLNDQFIVCDTKEAFLSKIAALV